MENVGRDQRGWPPQRFDRRTQLRPDWHRRVNENAPVLQPHDSHPHWNGDIPLGAEKPGAHDPEVRSQVLERAIHHRLSDDVALHGFDCISALPLAKSTGTEMCCSIIFQPSFSLRQTSVTRKVISLALPLFVSVHVACWTLFAIPNFPSVTTCNVTNSTLMFLAVSKNV